MPKISVLIPIYNTERYLPQSLDSLRAQTFEDFEVICINDGSTDSSADIVARYAAIDQRFRSIDKPNSGYGASMNRGLAEARGDYIAILEPDDFFEPTALETLYAPIAKDSASKRNSSIEAPSVDSGRPAADDGMIDVVKANYWFYWLSDAENAEIVSETEIDELSADPSVISSFKSIPEGKRQLISVIKPFMAGHVLDPHEEPDIFFALPSIWSALYRREFLEEHDIRFLETPGASFQDTSFTFKVWAYARNVVLLEDPILNYRQDNEASSVNDPSKSFCIFEELAEIDRVAIELAEQCAAGIDAAQGSAPAYDCAFWMPIVYRIKYDCLVWNYQRLPRSDRSIFLQRAVTDLRETQANAQLEREDITKHLMAYQHPNHDLMIDDPMRFDRLYPDPPTRLAKAWYYFRIGGFPALLAILRR